MNNMENLKKIFEWTKNLPIWIRAILYLMIAAIAFIASLSLSACGTTRAVVHNGATGTSTEIRITTNNPTSVTASPNVTLKHSSSSYD